MEAISGSNTFCRVLHVDVLIRFGITHTPHTHTYMLMSPSTAYLDVQLHQSAGVTFRLESLCANRNSVSVYVVSTHLAFSLVLQGTTCFLLRVNGLIRLKHVTMSASDVEFRASISTLLSPTVKTLILYPTENNVLVWITFVMDNINSPSTQLIVNPKLCKPNN